MPSSLKLQFLYHSTNTITTSKPRISRWTKHAVRVVDNGISLEILTRISPGNKLLHTYRSGWHIISKDVTEVVIFVMMAQYINNWRELVNEPWFLGFLKKRRMIN